MSSKAKWSLTIHPEINDSLLLGKETQMLDLKVPENTSFKHQMMLSSAWGFSLGVGLGVGFFFLMLLFWKFNLIPPLK